MPLRFLVPSSASSGTSGGGGGVSEDEEQQDEVRRQSQQSQQQEEQQEEHPAHPHIMPSSPTGTTRRRRAWWTFPGLRRSGNNNSTTTTTRMQMSSSSQHRRTSSSSRPARAAPPWGGDPSTIASDYTNRPNFGSTTSTSKNSKAVWRIRVLFLVCLACVALGLSILTWYVASQSERQLGVQQFDAVASRALEGIEWSRSRRRQTIKGMSQIAGNAFPNASSWPNVAVPAFETIASDLIRSSTAPTSGYSSNGLDRDDDKDSGGNSGEDNDFEMGFYPMVRSEDVAPGEQSSFEEFALNYLSNEKGYKSFGRGIWNRRDEGAANANNAGGDWESNYTGVMFPELQNSRKGVAGTAYLMLDIHAEPATGQAIDEALACSEDRRERYNNRQRGGGGGDDDDDDDPDDYDDNHDDCGAVTNITHWNRKSYFVQPIYPANDPYELVGVIASQFSWDGIVSKVLAYVVVANGNHNSHDSNNGNDNKSKNGKGNNHPAIMHVVLQSEGMSYTYLVNDNATSTFIGQGDLHDPRMSPYGRNATLVSHVYRRSSSSPSTPRTYHLFVYPTDNFFRVYTTNNPLIATLGAVAAVVFTALIFFLYDFVVRREFTAKRRLLQAKRKFMRFVSHEMRTPLNAVCMGLTLLQEEVAMAIRRRNGSHVGTANSRSSRQSSEDDGADPERAAPTARSCDEDLEEWLKLLGEIYSSAQGSVDVLNDLLNYDKIESGTLSLELTVFNIWNLIVEASNEFRLSAKKKKIDFHLDLSALADGSPGVDQGSLAAKNLSDDMKRQLVVADSMRIAQVLRNLVSNAIKFTPEGGKVTVRCSWVRPNPADHQCIEKHTIKQEEIALKRNGFAKIEVIDDGIGISKEQVEKLFRPGVQFNANEVQGGQGSGLGLFISKGIVRQHEGTLHASSEGLGDGSTFTCTLPLYHDPNNNRADKSMDPPSSLFDAGAGCAEEEEEESAPKETADKATTLRVLVVDDVATNRKLLSRLIQKHGHRVEESKDGQEAVDKVLSTMEEGSRYDSILMDYEMPVLRGPEAAVKIRGLGCDSYIVGITGNVLADDVRYFVSCGANAVLPKPVDIKRLEMLWNENGLTA